MRSSLPHRLQWHAREEELLEGSEMGLQFFEGNPWILMPLWTHAGLSGSPRRSAKISPCHSGLPWWLRACSGPGWQCERFIKASYQTVIRFMWPSWSSCAVTIVSQHRTRHLWNLKSDALTSRVQQAREPSYRPELEILAGSIVMQLSLSFQRVTER